MKVGSRKDETHLTHLGKFFIEIGTSDFDTFEHLAVKGWKGIFVEPVKELLDNLTRYDGCIYENCAVLDKMGNATIQYYDPEWAAVWIRGVGSISSPDVPDINNFHSNPQWKEHRRTREVKVVTLDHLIEKHQVTHIDFLKIDIEGLEYRILNNYSWKIKPDIIKVEYKHWDIQSEGTETLEKYGQMLEKLGYVVSNDDLDMIGILKNE